MNALFKNMPWLVLFMGLIVFGYSSLNPSAAINDAEEYAHLAENLSQLNIHYAGDLNKATDYRLYSKRPILYAALINIAGASSDTLLKVAQMLMLVLLFILSIQLLKVLGKSNHIKILSVLFLFSLPLFFSTQFIMADLLLAVLVTTIIWLVLVDLRNKTSSNRWSIALLWALAIWVKPIVFPTVAIAIIVVAVRFKLWKPLLLVVVSAASLIVHNQRLTGVANISSITAINRSHYNAKLLIAQQYGSDSAQKYTSSDLFSIPRTADEYMDYNKRLNARSTETILSHFPNYIKIQLMGMAKAVVDPGRFEIYSYFNIDTRDFSLTEQIYAGNWSVVNDKMKENIVVFVLFLGLLLVSLIKAMGFAVSLFNKDFYQLILVAVVAYFLILAGPLGAFRFLIPAFPIYLVLSSLGIGRLLRLQKSAES